MLNCVPSVLTAGDTWEFSVSGCYSATLYTAIAYFSRGGQPLVNVAGVAQSDGSFVFTFSATVTAVIAEGDADYLIRYSEIATPANKLSGAQGTVFILPNLVTAQTPTHAQTMVSTLESACTALAGTTDLSVSFNGQSFTSANIDQYRKDLVFWQSRVIKEQSKRDAARRKASDGRISYEFAPQAGMSPFNPQNPFS